MLLLRPVFSIALRLAVLGNELGGLNVIRFPIEIENLFLRTKEILGGAMALQTPLHAVRLGYIHGRHLIDRTMATEAADAPIDVRGMVVKNVIYRAMQPDPLDRLACIPALPHR